MDKILSKEQKVVMVTLYKLGVRGIKFQEDNFSFSGTAGLMQNLKFDEEIFNFSHLGDYMEIRQTYSLESIIRACFPEYAYVLEK